jgi:hypothetical protein
MFRLEATYRVKQNKQRTFVSDIPFTSFREVEGEGEGVRVSVRVMRVRGG